MTKKSFFLAGGDFLWAGMAYGLAVFIHWGLPLSSRKLFHNEMASLCVFAAVLLVTTYFSELYNLDRIYRFQEIIFRLCASLVLAFFALSALYHLFPTVSTGNRLLVLALAGFGILQLMWHKAYQRILLLPGFAERVLIFGTGPMAMEMREVLKEKSRNAIFAGYIGPEGDVTLVAEEDIVEVKDSLVETAQRMGARKIIVALRQRRGILPVHELLLCKFAGIDVIESSTFYEELTGKLMLERINASWFVFSTNFRVTTFARFCRFTKRIFDIIFAIVGLCFAAPLLPVIALCVKLSSPGPVFFRQTRVGMGEKIFSLLKFRTMFEDAERITGAVWAQQNDPRITPLGRFLRKTRLDELPQLFNVLKGDMSFVGPRPERPEFVNMLNEKINFYSKRHTLKPGITGWAQVRYPYGSSLEDSLEKLKYDLYYIKNYSFHLDFFIILETIKVVLFGRGGR